MAILVTAGNSEKFEPAPPGLHQAICVDVVDMGVLEVTYAGQTKKQRKVRIVWQIDELMASGKPFIVQKRYTASLHEKATLRKELESWRGRPFTEEELEEFDLEAKLIGANAQVNVQHTTKDGTTYANVVSVVPLGKGMQKLTMNGYVRVKDRTDVQPVETPEITADDIPFLWLMPLLLPAIGLLGAVLA
jgi:hypothetical protein